MWAAWTGFVILAINPFGGVLFAIPYAQGVLHISPFLAAAMGWPLSYVQVLFVDLLWHVLWRWERWQRLIERKRTPRLQRMASSRSSFWLILLFGAFVGPWLVMAVMRFSNVPHRKIALPLALSLGWNSFGIALLSNFAPRLLPK
jgi:hypothetical protein